MNIQLDDFNYHSYQNNWNYHHQFSNSHSWKEVNFSTSAAKNKSDLKETEIIIYINGKEVKYYLIWQATWTWWTLHVMYIGSPICFGIVWCWNSTAIGIFYIGIMGW